MRIRTKEEMREYQRQRRARQRGVTLLGSVTPHVTLETVTHVTPERVTLASVPPKRTRVTPSGDASRHPGFCLCKDCYPPKRPGK